MISHKALVRTACSAALLAGIPEDMVFTIADGPEPQISVQSIEYVAMNALMTSICSLHSLLRSTIHPCARELIAMDLTLPDLPPVDPRDVVFLPFSSGTTGRPKVLTTVNCLVSSRVKAVVSNSEYTTII